MFITSNEARYIIYYSKFFEYFMHYPNKRMLKVAVRVNRSTREKEKVYYNLEEIQEILESDFRNTLREKKVYQNLVYIRTDQVDDFLLLKKYASLFKRKFQYLENHSHCS